MLFFFFSPCSLLGNSNDPVRTLHGMYLQVAGTGFQKNTEMLHLLEVMVQEESGQGKESLLVG